MNEASQVRKTPFTTLHVMSRKRAAHPRSERAQGAPRASWLRIIGGRLRARRVRYHGDPVTRPMKDRVREAVFNLIGEAVQEKLVIDLFSGTGAMAFEALSRGARQAILVERRFPAVHVIRENAASLGLEDQIQVVAGDAFLWGRHPPDADSPSWLVFICPPYEFFDAFRDQMLRLIQHLLAAAPGGSVFVVESDGRFDVQQTSYAQCWDVRSYPPAVIAIMEKPLGHEPTPSACFSFCPRS